jgi:hypothetical protein
MKKLLLMLVLLCAACDKEQVTNTSQFDACMKRIAETTWPAMARLNCASLTDKDEYQQCALQVIAIDKRAEHEEDRCVKLHK